MITALVAAWALGVAVGIGGVAVPLAGGPERLGAIRDRIERRARQLGRKYRYRGQRRASVGPVAGGAHRMAPQWGWV